MTSTGASADLFGPGLGETQRLVLLALKQRGPSTVSALSAELGLAPTTLRGHLQALAGEGLVARHGLTHGKRGRPDVVFAVGPEGERLFPRFESQVLGELIRYLSASGRQDAVEDFFASRVSARRERLLPRVQGLQGVERLREVARIMSEEGFMARVDAGPDGRPRLHLCHCPLQGLVAETRIPCRYEESLLAEFAGSPIDRIDYLPDGGTACSYLERAAAPAQPSEESP